MMKRKILPFLLMLIFSGCIDDTYFGLSKEANIILFDIEGQLSNKIEPMVDWKDVGEVTITVPTTYDLKKLKVTQATCSQLARFTVDPYTLTDFSTPVEIIVGAENTSIRKKWIVTVTNDGEISNQLAFSKMDRWAIAKNSLNKEIAYMENGVSKCAYVPGVSSAISPWQTPAEANAYSLSGINTVTVGPRPTFALAEYSRIETIWVKSGQAAMAKAQVVTGALFTGSFQFNIKYAPLIGTNEPRKMVNIGTPFTFRPKSATF
jgi:hypothetical protein